MTFEELNLPLQETAGKNYKGLWFVPAVDQFAGYLLNDNSGRIENVGTIYADNKRFYFPTEANAHLAAAEYYRSHTRIYPYQNEWSAALNHPSKPPTTLGTIKSESMEF